MGQSKRASFAEAIANTSIGYGVSILAQIVIFPAFGLRASLPQNLAIGACFTLVSLVRGYVVRRLFNRGAAR